MTGQILVATWHCLGLFRISCPAGGTGDPAEMDLIARKHLKDTNHGVCTHQRLVTQPAQEK